MLCVMFKMLIDACAWLDLAKDRSQAPGQAASDVSVWNNWHLYSARKKSSKSRPKLF
jgi:hypothetical protein